MIKLNTRKVFSISAGHFLHDIFTSFVPAIAFLLKDRYQLSYFEITLLVVFSKLPSIFGPVIGIVTERVGAKPFIIVMPLLTAIFVTTVGISPSFILTLLLIFMAGVCAQFYHVPAPVLINQLSVKDKGRNMSFFMIGGEAARTLGPIIIMSFLTIYTLDKMYALISIGIVASLILLFSLRDCPEICKVKRSRENSFSYIQFLLKQKKLFYIVLAVNICKGFTASTAIALISTYLKEAGHSSFISGSSLSVMALAAILGVGLSGYISDKIGRLKTITMYTILSPISLLLFATSNGFSLSITTFLLGVVSCSITPVVITYVQEIRKDRPSFFNGTYMTFSFLLTSLIVLFMGKVSDFIGIQQTFYLCSILSCSGFVILQILKINHHGLSDEQ